jgi:tRNA(fMet)-specific endonuclease VapC
VGQISTWSIPSNQRGRHANCQAFPEWPQPSRPPAQGLSFRGCQRNFIVITSGSAKNRLALEHFLQPLEIADFDPAAVATYGEIRQQLEAAGTPIGPLDTQIAAHAVSLGVTLVSNDGREFQRVTGLRLENWA